MNILTKVLIKFNNNKNEINLTYKRAIIISIK